MMKRGELREAVFKYLFMSEFNEDKDMPEQIRIFFKGVGSKETDPDNNWPDPEDARSIEEKYLKAKEKIPRIDSLLNKTSVGWKTSRMNKVDLSILRLAVYEMLFDEEVPLGVAINEAVELAKRFGGEDSASFINGILGRIARDAELKEGER